MGMLDRIKKRSFEGFKEFVINMETTGATTRQQILTAGILEDPLFMSYVMKNLKTFDDFINLSTDDIDTVLSHQEQMVGVFAKCLYGLEPTLVQGMESSIPKHSSKLRDELSYLKDVSPSEKEGAKYFIMKVARKLQVSETIQGFQWSLPPTDLFHPKTFKDGKQQIFFESGVMAAEGDIVKGKRSGSWKHFYDSGKLLAEGEYLDGYKNAVWIFHYGNGNIKSQGRYKSDLKHGEWKEWDRAGNEAIVDYVEGVKKEKAL